MAGINVEPCEDPVYDKHDVVETINEDSLSLLYADHEIKEELVIGPTVIRRPVPVKMRSVERDRQQALTRKRIAALPGFNKKELEQLQGKHAKQLHFQVLPGSAAKTSKLGLVAQPIALLPGTPSVKPVDAPWVKRSPHAKVQPRSGSASRCQIMAPTIPSPSPNVGRDDGWTSIVPMAERAAANTAGPSLAYSKFAVSAAINDPAGAEEMAAGPSTGECLFATVIDDPAAADETAGGPSYPEFAVATVINDPAAAGPSTASTVDGVEEDLCEVIIGCDDGSDIDINDINDIDDAVDIGGYIPISRLIDPDTEDSAVNIVSMGTIDSANDDALALLAQTEFDWTNDSTEFTGVRAEFTGEPGPTFPMSELVEPVDSFLKMVEPQLIDRIVTETNDYARYTIEQLEAAGKVSARSRLRDWQPTTPVEMYRFLALLIAQGLYPNPVEVGYWTGPSKMELFYNTMAYGRFILLKKFLHFADNRVPTDDNMTKDEKRLRKIQPVVDYFRGQFKGLYYPHQEVAIDESLLKWKGPLGFTQKISTKAAQVGIKSYELCAKNGYLWDFFYYTGSKSNRLDGDDGDNDGNGDGNEDNRHDMPRPNNATAKIVIDLAEPLFGKGHTIVMDNFYNSPLLARFLKNNRCDCYGTLRLNRQHVPESLRSLTRTSLNSGDILSSNTKDLTVLVWRDTGLVSMISTYHKPTVGHQTKYGKTKFKPAVVLDYNKTMGGVDRKDQILASQPMERSRNIIWYKKVFRRLLNTAVHNSHIIFLYKVPKITHRTFREQVVTGLLQRFTLPAPSQPRAVVRETVVITAGRPPFKRVILAHRHFPVSNNSKSKCCVWCSYKFKQKARTAYKCKECNVNLCIKFCFEQFHTEE